MVKNLPAIRETWVRPLGWKDPLEKGMTTCSSILAKRIPWTILSMGHKELDTTEHLSFPRPEWKASKGQEGGFPSQIIHRSSGSASAGKTDQPAAYVSSSGEHQWPSLPSWQALAALTPSQQDRREEEEEAAGSGNPTPSTVYVCSLKPRDAQPSLRDCSGMTEEPNRETTARLFTMSKSGRKDSVLNVDCCMKTKFHLVHSDMLSTSTPIWGLLSLFLASLDLWDLYYE